MNEAAVTFETYKSHNPAVNRQQCFRTARGMNWTANRGSQRESWEGESPGGSAVSEWAETHRKVTSLRAAVSSGGPSARGLLMWRVNHPESADSFLPQNRAERHLDYVKRKKKDIEDWLGGLCFGPLCACAQGNGRPFGEETGPTRGVCTPDGSGNLWSGSGAAENPRLR